MKAIFKSAVHIILINDNKILLQKRKGSKLWPGYYALPAGHIDEGETQYDALVREAKEELGIEINTNDIISYFTFLNPPIIFCGISEIIAPICMSCTKIIAEHFNSISKWHFYTSSTIIIIISPIFIMMFISTSMMHPG